MDLVKLSAAIIITLIILGLMAGFARLIDKTDGLILLVIMLVGIVAVVYCSL